MARRRQRHVPLRNINFVIWWPVDRVGSMLALHHLPGRIRIDVHHAVTWLRTKARELKAQGQPWFMAVKLVNPHDADSLEKLSKEYPPRAPSIRVADPQEIRKAI